VPAGKTKELVKHLGRYHRGQRILCITFRRSLADKLARDFSIAAAAFGDAPFVNYLDIKRGDENSDSSGLFTADRLVVQYDSIRRVDMRGYDIVIIDEVLSMALHSRSSTMQLPTDVLQALEFFLTNCKRIILLDANADDMPAFNFVQCIERLTGLEAYWIRNRHVRPMADKRSVRVFACNTDNNNVRHMLQSMALTRVSEIKPPAKGGWLHSREGGAGLGFASGGCIQGSPLAGPLTPYQTSG
jgi:hypothetical protein